MKTALTRRTSVFVATSYSTGTSWHLPGATSVFLSADCGRQQSSRKEKLQSLMRRLFFHDEMSFLWFAAPSLIRNRLDVGWERCFAAYHARRGKSPGPRSPSRTRPESESVQLLAASVFEGADGDPRGTEANQHQQPCWNVPRIDLSNTASKANWATIIFR